MKDLAPALYVAPALFLAVLLLAPAIAFLPPGHARTRRSLALLIVLTAALGITQQLLSLPIGGAMSLALFLGLFAVIYLMGRFDSPE
ncbi:MAG: hypothetical protein ACXWSD_13095 [Bdellovibrionota bacterium]